MGVIVSMLTAIAAQAQVEQPTIESIRKHLRLAKYQVEMAIVEVCRVRKHDGLQCVEDAKKIIGLFDEAIKDTPLFVSSKDQKVQSRRRAIYDELDGLLVYMKKYEDPKTDKPKAKDRVSQR